MASAAPDPRGDASRRPAWSDRLATASMRLWPLIFLVWLLGPVLDGVRSGTAHGLTTAAALLVLMTGYVRASLSTFGPTARPGMPARLTALVTLAVVAFLYQHEPGVAVRCLVYLAVVLVLTFSQWVALPTCLATAALARWGPSADPSMSILVLVAGISTAFGAFGRRRGMEARAAQEATARLQMQEERHRIARDVHDILGHSLTVITVKAQLAGRLVDLDPQRAKAELADLERLSRSALTDVRRTVSQFREVSLAGELAGARQALQAAGIRPVLPNAVTEASADLHELFAWVVREGTTNVIRHSGARTCEIRLDPTGIEVLDDGHGCDRGPGNGLSGLAERARAAGAVVTGQNRPGGGFVLQARLPDPADFAPAAPSSTMTV